MSHPNYRIVHAIPAFMVGGVVWCVLALFLSKVDYGVLGFFTAPGNSTFIVILTAAVVFFPLFVLLRWVKLLNMGMFAGGLALATLALAWLSEPSSGATLLSLFVIMSLVAGSVAFLVLRGGARADAGRQQR